MDRYWSTQAQKWIYPTWKVERDSDDESGTFWWDVTDTTDESRYYRSYTEEHAEWLCNLLNGDVPE
jgi:hypothetical protein